MPIIPNYIPKILIIDDEPFNLEFLELVLRQQGYKIITAKNGRKGIELAGKLQPDMILLDIMMPGETGFECATILRLSPETAEIPIIFLTALDDAKSTLQGFDAGAIDFITKPFEYREVLHRIRLHLRIAQSDKFIMNNCPLPTGTNIKTPSAEEISKSHTQQSFFPSNPEKSNAYLYENVIFPNRSESHLLLNSKSQQLDDATKEIVREALAQYSGPLYSPSETLRNIGIILNEAVKDKGTDSPEIDGIYAHINRDTNSMIVVNAGALPAIYIDKNRLTTFIEPQSGPLGELGKGLLPCSTNEMKKNSRLFIYSDELLSAFSSTGEGITALKETCELSNELRLEASCQAAGNILLKERAAVEGLLVAIEA